MHASFWLLLLIQAYSCPASEAQPLILLHMQKKTKKQNLLYEKQG
jgi:accessory gene regulator protein AgrB